MRVCQSGHRKVVRCPYYPGVRIKRVNVERGSTVQERDRTKASWDLITRMFKYFLSGNGRPKDEVGKVKLFKRGTKCRERKPTSRYVMRPQSLMHAAWIIFQQMRNKIPSRFVRSLSCV